jgi:hypothetical protein
VERETGMWSLKQTVKHIFRCKAQSTSLLQKWVSLLGLTQKPSQTLISPCRASCYNGGNPRNALATLCLCGLLFRNSCLSRIYVAHAVPQGQRREDFTKYSLFPLWKPPASPIAVELKPSKAKKLTMRFFTHGECCNTQ